MSNFPLPGGRGDNKNLGESFACWWEAQVKMSKFNFLTLKCIFHLSDFLQSVSQSVSQESRFLKNGSYDFYEIAFEVVVS